MLFSNVKKETFVAMAEVNFKHNVNGEKSLSGTIYLGDEVLQNIDRGWTVNFENEVYFITYAKPIDNGRAITVTFDAIHEFFYKMGKSSVYKEISGSHTARTYLDFIFSGSGYTYSLGAALSAFEKENFGMKNRLSLFNDFINSTNTEFTISGKNVTIVEKTGSDLSTLVRKGFNMQELGLEYNIGNFVTYAKGFGAFKDPDDHDKGRLIEEYKSPLAAIYGVLESDPVVDERYTQSASLIERLKELVESSYSISVSLSVEDLQSPEYNYAFPQPGDYILAINEQLNFSQKIRIIGIDASYDIQGNELSKSVTCNSLNTIEQKRKADASNSQNWSDIANGIKPIPNEWLTNAIQNATTSLLNAETELKFTTNGILAVDKTDHNRIVILNSSGVGVSTDGGKTFGNAITADGVNASAIRTGILEAIAIKGVSITGSMFETDGTNGKIVMKDGTIDFYNKAGQSFGKIYPKDWTPTSANNSNESITIESQKNIWLKDAAGTYNSSNSVFIPKAANSEPLKIRGSSGIRLESGTASLTFERNNFNIFNTGELYLNDGLRTFGLIIPNNCSANFYSPLNMNGYSIYNQSDIRLKENIIDTEVDGIAETKKLNFVEFDRKQEYKSTDETLQPNPKRELGLIAQDTPFLVSKGEDDNYLSIDVSKQINLNSLTNKQLVEKVEAQEKKLQRLEELLLRKGESTNE